MFSMATAESNGDGPAATLTDLLDAEDEKVQIRAAEAILDRAGPKATDG